ncbi:MAG: hypothetical protein JSV65_16320 [Armatimonadota bacterium]|nr:MAG: hypothetical protein JSV65_16320 [Armatimonadota bacterium]
MKVVHLIFETQFEAEVIGLLHREIEVPSYTRVDNLTAVMAIQRGGRLAYRLDDGNSMMIVVCADDVGGRILAGVATLRERLGHGVHAYVTQAEQVV